MDPTARFTTGLLVHAKLDSDSNVAVSRTAPTRQTEIAALIQVAMQRLLEAMSLDAIIVDAEMNVLFANDLAQRTLREADVVTVTHGRLRPADPSRGRALYGLIARMVDGSTAATECIALLRPSGNPLYILGRAIGGGIRPAESSPAADQGFGFKARTCDGRFRSALQTDSRGNTFARRHTPWSEPQRLFRCGPSHLQYGTHATAIRIPEDRFRSAG